MKACSLYPALVAVPVVSHSFVPLPMSTFLLMAAGCSPFPPLWPGSSTMTLPRSDTACPAAGPSCARSAPPGAVGLEVGGWAPCACPSPGEPPHAVSAPRQSARAAAEPRRWIRMDLSP